MIIRPATEEDFGEITRICDPPNHASSIFHARFGFSEAGRHAVDGGKKTVSLQVAPVRAQAQALQ